MNKAYKQYFDLIFGSTLLTLGIYLFVTPNGINFGGVIGLAQIIEIFLRRFIAIRSDANLVGMINFLINVPLFLIGYRVMSRRFCIKTMLGSSADVASLSTSAAQSTPCGGCAAKQYLRRYSLWCRCRLCAAGQWVLRRHGHCMHVSGKEIPRF